MIAVAALALSMHLPSSLQQMDYCREARQERNLNLPLTSTADSTDIVHMSVIYRENRFIGYVYVTRNRSAFFHLGEVASGPKKLRGSVDAAVVTRWLKVQDSFGFQRLRSSVLAPGNGINIMSCY
uniref:Uncharacterized protein n=1 Tax=mine drainage metagenome TaxID=410659 RepID=E6Q1V0_9ZZZZ